jgi:hypothetical protein
MSSDVQLVCSMGLETIEFIIHKDGRVEEKVTGVKGTEVSQNLQHFGYSIHRDHKC